MKIHITNIYNQSGTAGISQHKIAEVAKKMGFYEMGIYRFPSDSDSDSELGKRIDGIISSLEPGDIVFMQSPSWNALRYDLRFVRKIKAYKNVKLCIFVSDVIPLLFKSGEANLRATIEIYNYADLIILPSKAMLELLRRYGLTVKKYIFQEIWDYPISFDLKHPQFMKRIFFTGTPERFPFLHEWKFQTPLILYSWQQFDTEKVNIEKRGYQKELQLLNELSEGGYGLVWTSGMNADEYYYLLQPYKLATFLAAGIPVIMQKGLAPEQVVTENGLGFVVESLEEADSLIQSISKDEYDKMVERIAEFNFLIKDGWFTKKMLTDAVMQLLNKKDIS